MSKSQTRFRCAVCGKLTAGRHPKGGDGTFYHPRRHKGSDGKPCDGNIEEAELVDVAETRREPEPAITTSAAELAIAPDVAERARALIREGTPENTIRARESALRYFWSWAELVFDLVETYPVSPAALLTFIVDHLEGLDQVLDEQLVARGVKAKLGPHSVATVEARCSHLAAAHTALGYDNPAADPRVVEILKAARKLRARHGGQKQPQAATLDRLNALLATCDDSNVGLRDHAILLVAFASGGRRRSELTNACVEDLEHVDSADAPTGGEYVLTLRYSKADQTGEGLAVPIAGRAATALTRWLACGVTDGPIFRRIYKGGRVSDRGLTPQSLGLILKNRARLAGLDPKDFTAHSLRSGFITEAAQRGIPLSETMAMSGHKTPAVAMRYFRGGEALHNQAARIAG